MSIELPPGWQALIRHTENEESTVLAREILCTSCSQNFVDWVQMHSVSRTSYVGDALKPQTPEEELIFAEERFRVTVQVLLYKACAAENISMTELARRMNMRPVEVTDLFDTGENLTVQMIGKICHALNISPELVLHPKT